MSAKQSQRRRRRPASLKVTPSARSARASPLRRFYDMGQGTEINTAAIRQQRSFACAPIDDIVRIDSRDRQQCTDAPDPKFSQNGALARRFPSPQLLPRPVLSLVLIRRAYQARPSNSAPPPRAGAAVGSKSSGFLAIKVCVVRINPATDAALRTAL